MSLPWSKQTINTLPVSAKHSSFQYLDSYILDLMIFSTKYCGFVPFTLCASFTVRFAILDEVGSRYYDWLFYSFVFSHSGNSVDHRILLNQLQKVKILFLLCKDPAKSKPRAFWTREQLSL